MRWVWHKNNKSPFRIIIAGFLLVILLGSLLLMLPAATRAGVSTSFMDALFTATSAVCVTGLVIHDTAAYWSFFGQLIIIILIQIGGLGVVTVACAFMIPSGRKIDLMQRSIVQEAIAAPNVGGIVRLTGFILRTSLLIEMLGAMLLFSVFSRGIRFRKGRVVRSISFHICFLQCRVRPDGDKAAVFIPDGLCG